MGSSQIRNLQYRKGFVFIGRIGSGDSAVEKRATKEEPQVEVV